MNSQHLAQLSGNGNLSLQATTKAGVLILAGEPIDEPVVHHGPFVMNTKRKLNGHSGLSDGSVDAINLKMQKADVQPITIDNHVIGIMSAVNASSNSK